MNASGANATPAPTTPPGHTTRRWLYPTLLATMVFTASLCATGYAWWNAQQELNTDFHSRANELTVHIRQRMLYYQQMLRSIQGFYAASSHVNKHELHRFVASLQIERLYPGIQDIGVVLRAPKRKKTQHIVLMRKQGYPAYERGIPLAVTQWGCDSEPHHLATDVNAPTSVKQRSAMAQAQDEGAILMTGKVWPNPAKADANAGFMMYVPIYQNTARRVVSGEKHAHLIGWLHVSFLMDNLLAHLNVMPAANLDLKIYDGTTPADDALLFDSTQGATSIVPDTSGFLSQQQIVIAGRTWTIVIHQRPMQTDHQPALIAGAGSVISALLALLIWSLASGRANALAHAARLTRNLRKSEARFRLMADVAPAMIWTTSANRKRLWVNQGWLEFTGFANTETFERQWRDCIHPGDLANHETIRDRAFATCAPFRSEYRARRHDGQYRWLMCTGIPRFDEAGTFAGFISSCFDITERKAVEEKLQLAALVYQNSSEAMFIADVDPRDGASIIIDVNPAHFRTTGFTPDEVIGKNTVLFKSDRHDDTFYSAIWDTLQSSGQWQGERWSRYRNGKEYLSWTNINAIRNAQGDIYRFVALSRDITESKEAEATIRSLSASLITAKEDEARRIAREIHDDLGQRLSWLRINLSLLPPPSEKTGTSKALANTVERMKESVDNCIQKIRNIASNLRPATLDMGLALAVESLTNDFRTSTGIDCMLHNALDEKTLLDDTVATNAYRILQEALNNAAKHAQAKQVVVKVAISEGNLVLDVWNDGISFDPTAPRIKRAHGLAGMQERAAMLGGLFRITSTPQKGTIVQATIPLCMQR